MYNIV